MRTRISTSLVAAALALPLLAGCGTGSESAAPAGSSAPASSAPAAPSSSAAASPDASPSPTSDPAAYKKDVQRVSEKFVKAVLTIGYPDKDVDQYADRIKPMMTKSGYAALLQGDSRKSASSAVEKLSAQKARTVPKLEGDVKVSGLTGTGATAKITYRNQAQLRDGDGWRVLKTSGKETATVVLVKDDGTWLVEEAR